MPTNRFKALRELNGFSQVELGNRLGVTQQSVFAWEHGKATPQIQTAITLSQLYNVSLDYLMGLSDDPGTKNQSAMQDDGLREHTVNRIMALPDSVVSKLLDLVDSIQDHQSNNSI